MKERPLSSLTCPTAAGLLVALGGPPSLAAIAPRVVGNSANMGPQIVLQLVYCGLAVFVLVVVLRLEGLPLRSVGLRQPDWSTAVTALLLLVTGLLLQALVIAPLVKAWGQPGADAGVAELAVLPAWFRVVLGATGGVIEEALYRGYAVERVAAITGHRWLGATLATLAFAAAHVPTWGVGFALVADLPAGIVLVLFYLWRRDLVANMLAHSSWIIVAMFTIVPPAV
jgi:membrane protease YdiL (CAAX protease family)